MLGHLQDPDRETLIFISRHLFQHHGQRLSKHKTRAHKHSKNTSGQLAPQLCCRAHWKCCLGGISTLQHLYGISKLKRNLKMTNIQLNCFTVRWMRPLARTIIAHYYITYCVVQALLWTVCGDGPWGMLDTTTVCVRVRTSKTTGK